MVKSKRDLKIAAKTAAKSGNLTNKQVNRLQKAGVKTKVIDRFKTSNAKGYAANRAKTVYNQSTQSQTQGPLAPGVLSIPRDNRINMQGRHDALANSSSDAGLRNPKKPENHWTNYDYGKNFGRSDIKDILSSGKPSAANKVLKIAQAAYAGGNIKSGKVNKLNKYLSGLNQDWINPRTATYNFGGNGMRASKSIYPNSTWGSNPGSKAPEKVYGWNGFGNGLTRYDKNGIPGLFGGGYEMGQQWSLPTKYLNGFGSGFNGNNNNNNNTDNTDNTDNTGDPVVVNPGTPTPPVVTDAGQFGAGDMVGSSAAGWRSAKGRRALAGRGAQGYGSMTIKSPNNYTAVNV